VTVLLPPEIAKWHFLEERIRSVLDAFGYREVRTPIVSPDDTLRPPGPAPLVRAFQEQGWAEARWYQLGPTFGAAERADLTGAVFAAPSPATEAETIAMLCGLVSEAGVTAPPHVAVAGDDTVGELLDRLGIAHRHASGSSTQFTIAAGDVTLCRGGRTGDRVFSFTLELAPLVAAIPDAAESYVLPPAAVFVASPATEVPALLTAHRLRLSGIRIELAPPALARTLGARLLVAFNPTDVTVEDLETNRTEALEPADLEARIRATMD
jgi:hypothetical protein